METPQKESIKFYQNLGKLFYAIAAVDNIVRDEEINKLKELVKNEWIAEDDSYDMFNIDTEPLIIDTFNWLYIDQEYDAETCFNSFIEYKIKNEHLFTDTIKLLIMRTAGRIASSFSGLNKSELVMLARLNIEFKKKVNKKD